MDIRFDGKIVAVTGAGSGIGFACAKMLAESGATVIMIGQQEEKIKKAAAMLESAGKVVPFALNITDREAVIAGVEEIRKNYGDINCLMQSAGRGFGAAPGEPVSEDAYGSWDKGMDLNATGSYQMMKEVVERCMLPNKSGTVVNIASMAGIRGIMPPLCDFGYSAGKAAVISMTQQGAVYWGHQGVRINAIAPGGVASAGVGADTRPYHAPDDENLPFLDIIPSGRHSTPEEVAAVALFLLSDFAGNITGQTIVVDGGASVMGF